jgi:uncharacterized protein
MPILVNVKNLEKESEILEGELTVEELALQGLDELIRNVGPLEYQLEVEMQAAGVLAIGCLSMKLTCDCGWCLQPFEHLVELEEWSCLAPLEGDDAVEIRDDCVDLTPFVREDILLAFPQYPKCGTECRGLPQTPPKAQPKTGGVGGEGVDLSVWAELSKLKLQ